MSEPKPHALNHGFAWEPTRGPFRIVTAEQARSYDERGFFVLEDAFDHATIDAVAAEIEPLERKVEEFLRTREDGTLFIAKADAITFTTHIVARSGPARRFCGGPVFQDLVHDLIGPDARLYWDQAVYKKPAPGREFPWHQDNGYTYIEPQRYLTCWVALNDATIANGCPWVMPGLHRGGTLEHWTTDLGYACLDQSEGGVPAPVRKGGIVVFSSLTPHRTGPNETNGVRKAYIVQFAPDGAVCLRKRGEGYERLPCDAPERQYRVLEDGRGVAS